MKKIIVVVKIENNTEEIYQEIYFEHESLKIGIIDNNILFISSGNSKSEEYMAIFKNWEYVRTTGSSPVKAELIPIKSGGSK